MPRPAQRLLLDQWPSYVVFALSFTAVGTIWANHRLAFAHLVRSDHTLVSLNLLELMTVAFVPVPTAVLGTWIGSSQQNRLTAVLLYGGKLFFLGVFHNMIWWYAAYSARLTSPALTSHKRRALTLTWLGGPVLYAFSVALAFIDPRLSVAMFVLLGVLYLLPTPRALAVAQEARVRRRRKKGAGDDRSRPIPP